MIQIKKAILHILDFSHDHLGYSDNLMPDDELGKLTFARKQVEKLLKSPVLKSGEFHIDSKKLDYFKKYVSEEISLLDLSKVIASDWYRLIKSSDKIEPSSLLCLDVFDNTKHYIVCLKYKSKSNFMYETKSVDGRKYEGVVENMAVLPNSSQSISECFIVNLETYEIKYRDIKRVIEGEEISIISERLLQCSSNLSHKEIISTINTTTIELCENYEMDVLSHVAKTKTYIQEKLVEDGYLRINELANEVFSTNEALREEYAQNLIDFDVPSDVFMHQKYAQNATKMQRIKTDTGIEIKIPSIYFDDKEHFEIIQNEDGTLSIQIKNILYVK